MKVYRIQLDVVGEPSELVGEVYTAAGPVNLRVVQEVGPAGGNPVVELTGTAPSLLAWLLTEYTDSLNEALGILGENGSAKRTEVL